MDEIPKAYEPQAVEEKWYARWLADGCFVADPASSKPAYSIVIPPPNVTGVLTLGHVLNTTIQDILARRARMLGREVLWLPGTDHAGIATQTVVERKLRADEGKTRRDLGRDEFLKRIWEWKEKHGGIIIAQLKKLGCSCDWTRERFTMDADYSRAVQQVFVDLYKAGFIYRGKRMVNWDPAARTALSDEEVIMKPVSGLLYYVKYEIVDEVGTFLEVATTRPETIMGDTAVAVHPGDARYERFVGKKCWRPFPRAKIPIIADEHIDPEFGTGVLKVTPAHDKNDFEIGERHGLEVRDVLNPDGTLNDLAGAEFTGMERFAARRAAAEKLRELGLLAKEEPYQNNVGYSERTDVPIEPRLSEQWFLRYPKVTEAREAVRAGEVRFRPDRWATVYEHWMENIQDWCISRQLWWGHRIPVWYKVAQASSLQSSKDNKLEACSTFKGFDASADVEVARRHLPHWRQGESTYFVTFRLADSLPAEKLAALNEERERWLSVHPEPWSDQEKKQYAARFSAKIEEWLDAGYGSCLLKEPRIAEVVAEAFRHFAGDRYELGSWVVMPNHVHVLVQPKPGYELSGILHSWKSYTATAINKVLGRSGTVWQHESYDHIVRDDAALEGITRYIVENPRKAGIVAQASSLQSSEDDKLEACPTYVGVEPPTDLENWTQDPDVLDTWFSSWLWPFATMDDKTRAKFYPTADLVTAPDIIFFWVARMVMAGFEFTNSKPFSNVFFTGLIRDQQGRKMSKSLGNSPDPLDLIAKYGADGLRFGLMRIAPQGQDIRFDEKQIEEGRNFANKLWNAARFRQMHGPSDPNVSLGDAALSIYSLDILLKLEALIARIAVSYDEYRFNEIAAALYEFFWSDYCDWYVEAAKTEIFSDTPATKESALAVMDYVLSRVLRLLHPFMPHISEELWERFGFRARNFGDENYMMFAEFPSGERLAGLHSNKLAAAQKQVAAIYESVRAARNLRAEQRVPSNKKVRFVLRASAGWIAPEVPTFARLINAGEVTLDPDFSSASGMPRVLTPLGELYLPLDGVVDAGAERKRLDQEIARVEVEIETVRRKLTNASFVNNAPAAVVAEHRKREKAWQEKLAQLRQMRDSLGK